MLKSRLFAVLELFPGPVRDKLLNIWQASDLRKTVQRRRRKRRAARHRIEREASIREFGKVGSDELLEVLRNEGIADGDLLFVQSSFDDLHTFDGSPASLVKVLQDAVGPDGTLLMPAYTNGVYPKERPFRPDVEPTNAGIVCETFRRSPDVIRSLHPRHSIVARGPAAKAILSGHENCVRADGPDSPFDRMRKIRTSKVLTLGLPRGYLSFLHWLEDYDPSQLPFVVHRSDHVDNFIELHGGTITLVKDVRVKKDVAVRLHLNRLFCHLSANAAKYFVHRGISIGIYRLPELANELLTLRDKGIIHYR